ncbi:helix-turn-helix transcriptional regulator [Streptomyces violaceochromogenes]|uniref:Helix-turn-helix transcriptional regulator n=1 Tax=Streptomyces violaceochromogenes TaxID=67377 RepID=A0ABU6M795_9ACTN|nr:helix-turn-helix transcriptional regulator [Streptomyces violaceochromogenes]MEC7057681.1 helix-turn-helix transcriptional regulator [Streptomyces violaceochromogenes]GHC52867.1 helix-turn-helix transcriptional regulator [Streptomyces violaceochromogenes]
MTTDASDAVEMRNALLRLRRGTGLPIAFGGLLEAGQQMRISELSGTATHALRSLVVTSGTGLGGKTVALSRPCVVTDYSASRQISHEYDAPVAVEGLRSVLAVPVVVRHRVRGVLYGALRTALPLGGRMLDAAVEAARDLERALAVRDEARTLVAGAGPGWEQVREAHAALRALAGRITDPELRAELLGACALLTAESAESAGSVAESGGSARVRLAPREVDVLACVAAGATNAVAADRLGVTPETVKGYLRSAMRKLRARTRGEAVVAARRAGWLP